MHWKANHFYYWLGQKQLKFFTNLQEIMMDHALRTISYIADIGDLVVLMARRRVLPTDDTGNNIQKTPKMICHVFESDEVGLWDYYLCVWFFEKKV